MIAPPSTKSHRAGSVAPTAAPANPSTATRLTRWLALAHGAFYVLSGLWPVVHLRSFYFVTGPKTDGWLVQTVGALLAAFGAALFSAGRRQRLSPEMIFLAIAMPLVLAAVDVIFVSRGVIPPIYLADAAGETLLALAWIAVAVGRRLKSPLS